MNVVKNILICITLAVSTIVVNGIPTCKTQLERKGFKMNREKTTAFMHAFNYLNPKELKVNQDLRSANEGYVKAYCSDLLERFLNDQKEQLKLIFQSPNDWYAEIYKQPIQDNKSKALPFSDSEFFAMSQEDALRTMFKKLRINFSFNLITITQRSYMEYVGSCIEGYIENTSVRSPLEYCEEEQNVSNEKDLKSKKTKAPFSSGAKKTVENRLLKYIGQSSQNKKTSSSVVARPIIDLNEYPMDEDN